MTSAHASNITPLTHQPVASVEPFADSGIEAAILGHFLLGRSVAEFARFAHLTEDHFYEPRHKRIWGIMKVLADEKAAIDLTSVKLRFKALTPEGEQFLLNVMTQAGSNPADYVTWLERIEWRRHGLTEAARITHLFNNRKLTLEQALEGLSTIVVNLQIKASKLIGPLSHTEKGGARDMFDTYRDEDRSNVGISSGYKDFDDAINGFEKGRVYLFGADTGVGKSILLQNLARNLKRNGQRGLIISFELPVKEYSQRAIAMESEIDLNTIKQHTMDAAQEERFYESLSRMANEKTDLHYVKMKSFCTFGDLKSKILEIYAMYGLDFVGLDYVSTGFMMPTEKAHKGDSLAFLEYIAVGIQDLAKELNIFFLNLAQTNRAGQSRGGEPQTRDFAGGAPLERYADMAAILQDVDTIDADDYGAAYLYILKSRTSGKKQIVKFKPQKNIFKFSDWMGS